jgi:hypothetical protein
MPATAGRVKMPHNNRVHTSSTLGTNSVWKDVIKYDPYGGQGGEGEGVSTCLPSTLCDASADVDVRACRYLQAGGRDSLFEQSKGLMELAKTSGLVRCSCLLTGVACVASQRLLCWLCACVRV